MNTGFGNRLIVLTLMSFSLLRAFSGAEAICTEIAEGKRPVTVSDAIEMTRSADELRNQPIAHYSPSGDKFVAILRKGNLEQNTNDFSMLLWRTNEVLNSPAPEVLVTFSSSSNRDAIEGATWLGDNETVAFLGERPGESHQLYTLNTQTHTLQKLTNHPTNLSSYSIGPDGREIAYTAEAPAKNIFDQKAQREGVVVSTQSLSDLLTGKGIAAPYVGDQQLFFRSDDGPSRLLGVPGQILAGGSIPILSPDGRYIAMPLQVAEIPAEWLEYLEPHIQELARRKLNPGGYSWLYRYVLIDVKTGDNRVLLDSPIADGWGTDLAWSPDSHSVLITNARLPLSDSFGAERQARRSKSLSFELNIPSGKITKITDQDVKLLMWSRSGNEVTFTAGRWNLKSAPKIVFKRNGDKWERTTVSTEPHDPLEITIEQSMNNPPRIVAVDPIAEKHLSLLNLNPNFQELDFAKVEEIEFKDSEGHRVKGGLYYPLHYEPGKRYPLVIQTHEWYRDRFLIDGPYPTAFAAQPLAAKGIMVLQAEYFEDQDPDWFSKVVNTPKEISRYVSAYEGGVDYLDEKGLIDRNRVGIIGFSRTCLYVKYALTHSRHRFAAASINDGIDGGYFQYIAFSTNVNIPMEFEEFNGGPPFGQSLKSWMKRSPSFNLDKVQTPVRITAENPDVVLFEWEWFAALRRLGKPVEMITMQDGLHELQRPWERLISLQGNVDWFCFWLKGEEDTDPAKAEQYKRWRELRKLQEENKKKATVN